MFSSLHEREMERVIKDNELVILTNRPELGLFTYGGVSLRLVLSHLYYNFSQN